MRTATPAGTLRSRARSSGTTETAGDLLQQRRYSISRAASDSVSQRRAWPGTGPTTSTGAGSLAVEDAGDKRPLHGVGRHADPERDLRRQRERVSPARSCARPAPFPARSTLRGFLFAVPAASAAQAACRQGVASGMRSTLPIPTIAGNPNTLPGSTISLPVGAGPNSSMLGGGARPERHAHRLLTSDNGRALRRSYAFTALQGLTDVEHRGGHRTGKRHRISEAERRSHCLSRPLNLGFRLSGALRRRRMESRWRGRWTA